MHKVLVILTSLALTGCAANFGEPLTDYKGSDSARIRAKNYLPPLALIKYKQVGDCYQELDVKPLTASLNVLGFKSTSNKLIPGMTARSPELEGNDVMEHVIQADIPMAVAFNEQTGNQYSKYTVMHSGVFIPERGHDYDVFSEGSRVIIKDLTSGTTRDWGNMQKCY